MHSIEGRGGQICKIELDAVEGALTATHVTMCHLSTRHNDGTQHPPTHTTTGNQTCTCIAGISESQLEGMGPKRFMLSVHDGTEFRARCEWMYVCALRTDFLKKKVISKNVIKSLEKNSRARPTPPNDWPQWCLLTLTVYLASSPRNSILFASPKVIHRSRSDSPLHFDVQNSCKFVRRNKIVALGVCFSQTGSFFIWFWIPDLITGIRG